MGGNNQYLDIGAAFAYKYSAGPLGTLHGKEISNEKGNEENQGLRVQEVGEEKEDQQGEAAGRERLFAVLRDQGRGPVDQQVEQNPGRWGFVPGAPSFVRLRRQNVGGSGILPYASL